jgi:hypothetical protein
MRKSEHLVELSSLTETQIVSAIQRLSATPGFSRHELIGCSLLGAGVCALLVFVYLHSQGIIPQEIGQNLYNHRLTMMLTVVFALSMTFGPGLTRHQDRMTLVSELQDELKRRHNNQDSATGRKSVVNSTAKD